MTLEAWAVSSADFRAAALIADIYVFAHDAARRLAMQRFAEFGRRWLLEHREPS